MIQCPYCGSKMEGNPEFIPMSLRRKTIFDFILAGGQNGVPMEVLTEKFFLGRNYTTIRTTIHLINKEIRPMKIENKGGIVRVLPKG